MVDAHRAGVAHGGTQHLPERFEAACHEAVRIVRGEAPVLSRWIELVGRRTDREPAQHDGLIHPGIGATGVDPDRSVEVEANGKAAPARDITATLELALGIPLQEFVEAYLVRMAFAQLAQRRIAGLPPGLRPLPPGARL